MWADKVRYGLQDLDLQLCQIAYAKSRVVDIAHARFRKNDCRVRACGKVPRPGLYSMLYALLYSMHTV